MAHYAIVDENNVVVDVITGVEGGEERYSTEYLKAIQTSYNTRGNVYYDPETGKPAEDQSKAFRGNYAMIGGTYDPERDAFIPVKAYQSFVLDEETLSWAPPIPKPMLFAGQGKWDWDEQRGDFRHIDGWYASDVIPNNPYPSDGNDYEWNINTSTWQVVS